MAVRALDHHARHRLGPSWPASGCAPCNRRGACRRARDSAALSALRSAVSSAFTGPLPSATSMCGSSPTMTLIVASETVTSSPARSSAARLDAEALAVWKYSRHVRRARAAPAARSSPPRHHRHSPANSRAFTFSSSAPSLGSLGLDRDADLAEPRQDVGAAGLVRHHDVAAHCRRARARCARSRRGSFSTAETWSPPLCAKAASPT